MNEKLLAALDVVSDRHIAQAAQTPKNKKALYLRYAAALLALVLGLAFLMPLATSADASELVSPAPVTEPTRPDLEDYATEEAYLDAVTAFRNQRTERAEHVESTMLELKDFWTDSLSVFLSGTENEVYSPFNAYMALAMLAETTSGSTRQEILEVLGVDSVESLREDVKVCLESTYCDRADYTRLIANSLWLDDGLSYRKKPLEVLGTDYHTSVRRTDLDSSEADRQIADWIAEQTQGLQDGTMPESADEAAQRALVLVSALYVEDAWTERFYSGSNTQEVFHAPGGDVTAEYMNGRKKQAHYARGENYTAVSLETEGDCVLWLVLPDEASSVSQLLDDGRWLDAVLRGESVRSVTAQLSMPKFDIEGQTDLSGGLQELGIREVFSQDGADFSGTLSAKGPIYVSAVDQSARFTVDEKGLRAASATEIVVSAKLHTDEEVSVKLDRPFLFVLTYANIPLFAGTMTNP